MREVVFALGVSNRREFIGKTGAYLLFVLMSSNAPVAKQMYVDACATFLLALQCL